MKNSNLLNTEKRKVGCEWRKETRRGDVIRIDLHDGSVDSFPSILENVRKLKHRHPSDIQRILNTYQGLVKAELSWIEAGG